MEKKGRKIIMRPTQKIIEPSDLLSNLQSIYASQIARFQAKANSEQGLSSRDIMDLNRLVGSMAIINREIRESRNQGILEGLPIDEQLKLLREALDTLGVTEDGDD